MSALSSVSSQSGGQTSPTFIAPQQSPGACEPLLTVPVGEVAHGLTAEERLAAIGRAHAAHLKHEAAYQRTGCFGEKGSADRAARLRNLLIEGRPA